MTTRPLLRPLRALTLGLLLYLYTFAGLWRGQPPLVASIQGAILLGLYGLWVWKAIRGRGLPRSPVALPLAALVGAVALAALFSRDPRLSLAGVFEVLLPVAFFFVFCELLLGGWSAGTFVDSLLILGAILILGGLRNAADWYGTWLQLRVPEYPALPVSFRLFGVADHPNLLASLLTLALPFAIMRLAQSHRAWEHAAYALWLAGADVVLFSTRSRGGWVAAGAASAITVGWLLFERRPQRPGDLAGWARRSWRIWLAAATYLGLFVALFIFDARSSQSGFTTSGGSVAELAGRPLFWSVAWNDFLAHPLTGSGPLTYPFAYVARQDAVREWISPHAHNLFLHVLAEEGIVGLLALGWVFAAGALALARGWRSAPAAEGAGGDKQRQLLVCVGAGLAGCCLVHAQADIPFWLPANGLLAVMLLAVGLQASGALLPGRERLPRWRLLLFVLPLVLVYVVGRQIAAYGALLRGGEAAAAGDWQRAARALDQAVTADPAFTFYWAQRGYAYGVLADPATAGEGAAVLQQALQSYRAALQAWPEHVPNLLNMAWLLDEAGSPDEAERMLAAAAAHGPDWALPALLLGERYAAQGRADEAEAMFAAGFAAEPQAREMAACQHSAACREAAGRIPARPGAAAQAHDRARALLAEGRPADALAALDVVPIASTDPLPWLDRADAHLALGQRAQAHYALTMATVLGAGDPATRAHYALSLAAYYLQQGRTGDAIAALERAARPQEPDSYNVAVYRRRRLPGLLLPGLARLARTAEDVAVYRELATLYTQERRPADAAWAEAEAEALSALLHAAASGE